MLVEHVARQRRQAGKDVTGAGGVLATLQPRTELACMGAQCDGIQGGERA